MAMSRPVDGAQDAAAPREEESGEVAVVIVNFRTPALTLDALRSLAGERADNPGLRVVVVDGGSGDGSAETLMAAATAPDLASWVSVLPLATNGGFGWANNQALLRLLNGPHPPAFIHLLNPDAQVEPGAVGALRGTLERFPNCAAVGSRLLNADNSVSGSAFRFPSPGRELVRGARTPMLGRLLGIAPLLVDDGVAGTVDWVTGASVMLRAEALREVGCFDTGFFLYFEEVELMWRLARAGWLVRHEPGSRVRHVGGAATGVTDARPGEVGPALPRYWFASRRRLFALTRGRWGAVAAGLMWLVGHGLWTVRRLVGLAGQAPTHREARDLLRYGLVPTPDDLSPAVSRWADRPGEPPAWSTPARPRR